MAKKSREARRPPILVGARTDTGRVRSNNEDAYCVLVPPNTAPGIAAVFVVADGMGGHQAGEQASRMAVSAVAKLFGHRGPAATVPPGSGDGRPEQIREALIRINREVLAAASSAHTQGMGTTLSLAVLEGGRLSLGHVGDSRIYLLRDGGLSQLTPDHSWVAEEVARGALTAEAARTHPRRNLLTQAIGIAAEVSPATSSIQVQQGDVILLCSDGLHGLVPDAELAEILAGGSPAEASERLIKTANDRGGTDNVTVIVARVQATAPLSREAWESPGTTTITEGGRGVRRAGGLAGIALLPVRALWWLLKATGKILRP